MIQLNSILVPLDFSDFSKQAFRYALALAEKFDAKMELLNVLIDMEALVPEPGMLISTSDQFMQDQKESALKTMQEWIEECSAQQYSIECKTVIGTPFLEIIRHAKAADSDLIIIGTHGRTGLQHVLMGSVAEKVVRKAPCPVLTVRIKGHQFVMP